MAGPIPSAIPPIVEGVTPIDAPSSLDEINGAADNGSLCAVVVRRHLPTFKADSWVALWKELTLRDAVEPYMGGFPEGGPDPSEADARRALMIKDCDRVCGVAWPFTGESAGYVVSPHVGGPLTIYGPLTRGGSGQCNSNSADIEVLGLDPIHASVTVNASSSTQICFGDSGAPDDDGTNCQSACGGGPFEIVDIFVSSTRAVGIARRGSEGPKKPRRVAALTLEGDTAIVRGGDCTLRVPLDLGLGPIAAPP